MTDSIPIPGQAPFRFTPPQGESLPANGYERSLQFYAPPAADGPHVKLRVDPQSTRIQLIEPFKSWDGQDRMDLELLIKVRGKCSKWCIPSAGSRVCM